MDSIKQPDPATGSSEPPVPSQPVAGGDLTGPPGAPRPIAPVRPGLPEGPEPPEEPLTVRSPGDVLAYIPHALGEWPAESLVAITVGRGRLGPILRANLPAPGAGGLGRFAEKVGDYVCSDSKAEGVVLALYTEAAWPEVGRPPHSSLLAAVGERLDASGLPVLDAWIVGPTHWRTVLCTDFHCCPWPGHSVDELRTGRVGAEMVYRGSSYGPPEIPEPRMRLLPPAARSAELQRYRDDPGRWWDPLAFTAALAAWDEVLENASHATPERLRLLAVTLARPALRDAVIVAAAADAGTAWRGSRATVSLRAAAAEGVPPALPGGVPAEQALAAARAGGGCGRSGGRPARARRTGRGLARRRCGLRHRRCPPRAHRHCTRLGADRAARPDLPAPGGDGGAGGAGARPVPPRLDPLGAGQGRAVAALPRAGAER